MKAPENGTAQFLKRLLLVLTVVGALFTGYITTETRITTHVKNELEVRQITQDLKIENLQHTVDGIDKKLDMVIARLP